MPPPSASANTLPDLSLNVTEQELYGSSRLGTIVQQRRVYASSGDNPPPPGPNAPDALGARSRGRTTYELSNHLGNVGSSVFDMAQVYPHPDPLLPARRTATVRTASDYFLFGEKIDARTYVRGEAQSASDKAVHNEYRYGFNGKEDDLTWGGSSLIQDYGFRLYSPGMGRFLSVDPLSKDFASWTPYAFAMNQPVWAVDLDGLERYIVTVRSFIPDAALDNPAPAVFDKNRTFAGDDRNYFLANSGAYRTEQSVFVDLQHGTNQLLNNNASFTTGFDDAGNVRERSEPGPAGEVSIADLSEGPMSTTINFNINAKNKLVGGAPAIEADVAVTLNYNEDGSFGYNLRGKLDGFPAYELFVQDTETGESFLLLSTNPKEAGKTPFDLLPVLGDESYNRSGQSCQLPQGCQFDFSDMPNTQQDR